MGALYCKDAWHLGAVSAGGDVHRGRAAIRNEIWIIPTVGQLVFMKLTYVLLFISGLSLLVK